MRVRARDVPKKTYLFSDFGVLVLVDPISDIKWLGCSPETP